ncbi:calcium-activated potassium channel subunit beta-1 [Lissotriton helveticus]
MAKAQLRMGKKLFTAYKRGETRAIRLGQGMILCSVMMYLIFGFTTLGSYLKGVWSEELECTLLQATIKGNESWSSDCSQDCCSTLQYPCLQVFVNLSSSGQRKFLFHTEDTPETNPKCSYIPECSQNYTEVQDKVDEIANNFRRYQRFPCYYNRELTPETVILTKLYSWTALLWSLIWPTFMLTCGVSIIMMVKISRHFFVLSVQKNYPNLY